MTIKLSKAFSKKIMESTFGKEYNLGFVRSFIQWMIDSKHRTYKQLDRFVAEQIENPHPDVVKTAKSFEGYRQYDKRIVEILRFVRSKVDYHSDQEVYGMGEKWAKAHDILRRGKGDCDDFNSTIYVLAILSGIPSYLLYNVIGEVREGGHYWLVYLSPDTGKLYPIDGTYYYDARFIPGRNDLSSVRYKKMWYVFNHNYIWKPK